MSLIACELYSVASDNVLASSLPVADYTVWSAGAYTVGQKVTHQLHNWECVADTSAEPGTSLEWLDLGYVAMLAPFDSKSSTQAKSTTALTYTLKIPDKMVNSLGLLSVVAKSISVQVIDDLDGVVYSKTYDMVDIGVHDIYEYWFSDYKYLDRVVDIELPPYYGCQILLSIEPSVDVDYAAVGLIALTYQHEIGGLEWGYGIGIEDYSTVERDVFGNTNIIERNYADTASFPVSIETVEVYHVKRKLESLRLKPVLWVGSPERLETVVFGIYESLGLVADNVVYAHYKLDLIGTI